MIGLDRDGSLWTVTIDRAEKANSLTADMLKDLRDIFRASHAPDGPNAVILTGAGRVFSAGADLDEARAGLATSPLWEELSGAIAAAPCLTIAALNGTLAGGAFGMVLACDLRLSVPGAGFFYPVMKLGFLPQPSDPGRLAKIAGPSFAARILLAGEKIPAEAAAQAGLVDAIVAPDALIEAARVRAADALSAERAHVAAIKGLLRP